MERFERRWLLGPDTVVVVGVGSPLAAAVDTVFGDLALRAEEGRPKVARTVLLEIMPVERGSLLLLANGFPIVRVGAVSELAPVLEGVLVGHAVRTRRNQAAFHAASVGIGGRGVMLLGSKGSGKSTLALWLAEDGASYFGDELAFIRFEDGLLEPFPKAATIKEGAFEIFRREVTHRDPIRGPVRYFRPQTAVLRARGGVSIELIVLPRYRFSANGRARRFACGQPDGAGGHELRVTPIDSADLALELVRQSFGGMERDPRTIALVGSLAGLPAYLIDYAETTSAGRFIQRLIA